MTCESGDLPRGMALAPRFAGERMNRPFRFSFLPNFSQRRRAGRRSQREHGLFYPRAPVCGL